MAREVREADLRALLEVAVIEPGERSEAGLPPSMLERVFNLIGCDFVSYVDFDPRLRQATVDQMHPFWEPPENDPPIEAFWRHYFDCLGCSYASHTGDERTVTMVSDFLTLPKFHSTGMYVEWCSRYREEYALIMCIPTQGDRTRRLHFTRGPGADFSERDRLLLSLLQPHLADACRHLERSRRGVPDLTARQWQLLRLAAAGHTNAEIASRLFVSPLTVRKHFENVFERLGVANRAAAVALAFPAEAEL